MIVYAIIPSRSGSKRFKNKNIALLNKKYLFSYTINFAKKLRFVKKIIFTSDSQDYLDKAGKFENVLLHKRSLKNAASEHSSVGTTRARSRFRFPFSQDPMIIALPFG